MTHEVHASIVVRLDDEPKEMARLLSVVANEWHKLLEALPQAAAAQFTVCEVKAKHAGNGVRQQRRRRVMTGEDAGQQAVVA